MVLIMLLSLVVANAIASDSKVAAKFGTQNEFFWGLATAPAHVEDNLNDSWLQFALQGRVAAFFNYHKPATRLKFWSNPTPEIELAAKTGVKVFRMGVDWGRLVPFKPGSNNCGDTPCPDGIQDLQAMKRYVEIVDIVRQNNMQVMMTLFHHSLPLWAIDMGGWKNKKLIEWFTEFSKDVVKHLTGRVEYWITFNEPSAFAFLTYTAGMWPPGKANYLSMLPAGGMHRAVKNMTEAHKTIYTFLHAKYSRLEVPSVGFANNVSIHHAIRKVDKLSASLMSKILNHGFVEKIVNYIDFHGINYYGEEMVKGLGVYMNPNSEYSESGRAIRTDGLYTILMKMHQKFNVEDWGRKRNDGRPVPAIPFIIAENGVSDSTDIIRPSYLIEHLMAVKEAQKDGVPVIGYVFWTISDNWEWADGYCPRFGLVDVDRANNLKRTLRPSYYLFSKIVQTGMVTQKQRDDSWKLVSDNFGKLRPFCRSQDGQTSLNTPIPRPIVKVDWRFKKPAQADHNSYY